MKRYTKPESLVAEIAVGGMLLSLSTNGTVAAERGSSVLSNGKEQPGNNVWGSSLWEDNNAE